VRIGADVVEEEVGEAAARRAGSFEAVYDLPCARGEGSSAHSSEGEMEERVGRTLPCGPWIAQTRGGALGTP